MKTSYRKDNPGCLTVVGFIALIIAVIVAYFAFVSWVFMTLWNIIVPGLFGGATIDLGMSFAIVLFMSIVGSLLGRGRSS